MFRNLLVGFMMLVCVASANAATLYVPAQYSTIQDGIDSAQDGDTVLVADGIYDEHNIKFFEKTNIILQGSIGTIVRDSEKCSTVVDISKSWSITIRGLTIDGQSLSHIGVNVSGGGDIDIRDCVIKNNTGAGIVIGMDISSFDINNNTISGNYYGIIGNGAGYIQDNVIQMNNYGVWVTLYERVWLHRNTISMNNIGIKCECAYVITVCVIIPSVSAVEPNIIIKTCDGNKLQIGGSLENANDIILNSQYGVYNNSGYIIDATYNYWGTVIEEEIKAAIYDGVVGAHPFVKYNPWTDAGHDQSLAVQLSSFDATLFEDKIMLQWRTESEVNNIGFSVYRNEQKIGFVSGAGNSAMPTDYQFQDNKVESGKTYFYHLEAIDISGERDKSEIIKITMPVAIPLPKKFRLLQNYPNPFNAETWIPYHLPQDSEIRISIYDARGRLIWETIKQEKAGYWKTKWQDQNTASGIYFYSLQTGDFKATRKMAVVK